MSRSSLLDWTNHPVARVLGFGFLVRDAVVTLIALGALATGFLGLGTVAIVLAALALGGLLVVTWERPASVLASTPAAAVAPGPPASNALRDLLLEEHAMGIRAQRLRAVRDEVKHIKRRFAQLEKNGHEWGTIRPHQHAPYQPLPAEKWNQHGVALMLPLGAHEVIQAAYEQANDFNHDMQTPQETFGEYPDPDLAVLRDAFGRAEAQLAAAEFFGTDVAVAGPSPTQGAPATVD
jgi:hypothetical protein